MLLYKLLERVLGVIHADPSLVTERMLLSLKLRGALKGCAVSIVGSILASPVVYKAASCVSLSMHSTVREFFKLTDKVGSDEGECVTVHRVGEPLSVRGKRCIWKPSVGGIVSSFLSTWDWALNMSVRMICKICTTLVPLGSSSLTTSRARVEKKKFSKQTIHYFLTTVIRSALQTCVTRCMVHVCLFGVCKGLDYALVSTHNEAMLPCFSASGVQSYFLADFSYSAFGYIARKSGGLCCRMLTVPKYVLFPSTNFFWTQLEEADRIWKQLTPTGFCIATALAAMRPMMHTGCLFLMNYYTYARKRTQQPTQQAEAGGNSGTITVGNVPTKRRMLSWTRQYLLSVHFIGTPLIAYWASVLTKSSFHCSSNESLGLMLPAVDAALGVSRLATMKLSNIGISDAVTIYSS